MTLPDHGIHSLRSSNSLGTPPVHNSIIHSIHVTSMTDHVMNVTCIETQKPREGTRQNRLTKTVGKNSPDINTGAIMFDGAITLAFEAEPAHIVIVLVPSTRGPPIKVRAINSE